MNQLVCHKTKETFSINEPVWCSPSGDLLDIELEVELDKKLLKDRNPNMWRYREVIPLEHDKNIISFEEGFTPLQKIRINSKEFFAKYDHLFMTGSFKDRGASVMMSKIKELGIKHVVEDSSGNAGCSVAAYCAKGGISCDIYVSKKTSVAKMKQIEAYGAKLVKISGDRQETVKAVLKAAEKDFYASHAWNPFFFQGTKLYAYEVWEQNGFKAPDVMLFQIGHGTLLIGAWTGFNELLRMGYIDKMPQFIAVQSSACAPVYQKLNNLPLNPPAESIAEGIGIAKPPRINQMLNIIRQTSGEILLIDDEAITDAMKLLWKQGLYVEPTGAAAVAGLLQYPSKLNGMIVAPLTGHGLKGK